MPLSDPADRRRLQRLSRDELAARQLAQFNTQLAAILPHNRFYAAKLGAAAPLTSLDDLASLPFTTKDELASTDGQPWIANLTWPAARYVRFHRTSGTRGRPLVVLDTADDWQWWLDVWQYVLDAAAVGPGDRALMAFSFGPFIGFWSANDALAARGVLVIPAGGLSTAARLDLTADAAPTVLCCTPSCALHLAEAAAEQGRDLAASTVRTVIVAGEPGGSAPSIRQRIETAWGAEVIDHAGATEVGPWGFADAARRGLHVCEAAFLAEFLSLATGGPAADGELAELVLTSLGRYGAPVIRYRTGDLVRPVWPRPNDDHTAAESANACRFVLLDGGVLGRVDDMLIIRGVNVFPSAVEEILRSFPEVAEYRLRAYKQGAMDALAIEVEDQRQQPDRIAAELQRRLGLKIDVVGTPLGSLPRFEGKGRRLIDERT